MEITISHQDESIERVRKIKVRFQITHKNEIALEGASVSIKQSKSDFPFECGMNFHILSSSNYQNCLNGSSPSLLMSLREAAEKRINSVVSRSEGELIARDVVNENLHFSFFEENLGGNASAEYFSKTYQLDPKPLLFMNEYNTIEYSGDTAASPANYIAKMAKIRSFQEMKEYQQQ
ncbi:hypothetical protein AHAS_Ahas09G0188900 [Arachis hypogaea]